MDIKYNKGDTGYLRRTDGRKVFDVSHVRTLLTALRDFHTPGTPCLRLKPTAPLWVRHTVLLSTPSCQILPSYNLPLTSIYHP